MTRTQQKIINRAPRLLLYHTETGQKGLILDTRKARQHAVTKLGATHFNILTFNFFGPDGMGSDYCTGDFCCRIAHKDAEPYNLRPGLLPRWINTADVALRARMLLSETFRVDHLDCRCLYLAPCVIAVSISSSAFRKENGGLYLDDLYAETASTLSDRATELGLEVSYLPVAPIENIRITSDSFAIPFTLDEASKLGASLERLATVTRSTMGLIPEWKINPIVLMELSKQAEPRSQWRLKRVKAWWKHAPNVGFRSMPVQSPSNNTAQLKAAQKCARRLFDWISQNKLSEFGQRDAQRATQQSLSGLLGDGGGVADALDILVEAHIVLRCPCPALNYWCKKPSPRFLVNPLLHGDNTHLRLRP